MTRLLDRYQLNVMEIVTPLLQIIMGLQPIVPRTSSLHDGTSTCIHTARSLAVSTPSSSLPPVTPHSASVHHTDLQGSIYVDSDDIMAPSSSSFGSSLMTQNVMKDVYVMIKTTMKNRKIIYNIS